MPGTRLGALLPELRRILPAGSILTEEEQLRPYECDGLTAYRQIPMVAVLPDTTEQVQAILALCSRERVPVVARGAGTGLSGGALPLAEGVLLSLPKFNRILEIDPVNRDGGSEALADTDHSYRLAVAHPWASVAGGTAPAAPSDLAASGAARQLCAILRDDASGDRHMLLVAVTSPL